MGGETHGFGERSAVFLEGGGRVEAQPRTRQRHQHPTHALVRRQLLHRRCTRHTLECAAHNTQHDTTRHDTRAYLSLVDGAELLVEKGGLGLGHLHAGGRRREEDEQDPQQLPLGRPVVVEVVAQVLPEYLRACGRVCRVVSCRVW